jgi:predicted ATPase
LRGWALAQQGRVQEGITQIQQGHSAWLADENELGKTQILARLAEVYGQAGRTEEGLCLLAEAFTAVYKNAERHYEADLYRLQGELVLQHTLRQQVPGSTSIVGYSEAEMHLRRAIEVAHRQAAKFLELRAVMSLSRLWQTQGKYTEARSMLHETYGWFTEGFDTPDLSSARALLVSLP